MDMVSADEGSSPLFVLGREQPRHASDQSMRRPGQAVAHFLTVSNVRVVMSFPKLRSSMVTEAQQGDVSGHGPQRRYRRPERTNRPGRASVTTPSRNTHCPATQLPM